MCYDVAQVLDRKIKYARHRKDDPDYIKELEEKLEKWQRERGPKYHASGFAHPELLVFTNEQPYEPKACVWGLIPGWVKDKATATKLYNQTLNARGETIFEKPAFRNAAKNKRCLIYVDGFFEHHHLEGKTYPFYVTMKDGSPVVLAGLWEEWVDTETGEIIPTVSIVTTHANKIMEKIHNNPKAEGPRMPVILPRDRQDEWLAPCKTDADKQRLQQLLLPFSEHEMSYHTVAKLRGKEAIGNVAGALEKREYAELSSL